jgi:alpha-L-fucosidase
MKKARLDTCRNGRFDSSGWFWHEKENTKVRTPQNLVNLYYQSVGRNSLLLLNIPPNRDGLLETTDVNAIKKFREILNETFSHNLVSKKHKFLIDKKLSSSKVLDVNQSLILQLEGEKEFDRISIQENIAEGQRIKSFW